VSSPTATLHVLSDTATLRADCHIDGDRVLVDREVLSRLPGWTLTAEGLCWGPVCAVSVPGAPTLSSERVDLRELVDSPGVPFALWSDPEEAVLVLGAPASQSADRLGAGSPAEVHLADLSGEMVALSDATSGRRVLVALASWCGCRFDVPVWQSLQEELRSSDVTIVLIAVDDDPGQVADWAGETNLAVLVDVHRSFCSAYGIVNVPTVVWLDVDGGVVRPNDLVFADNSLSEHHGLDCTVHHEQLRRWAETGELPGSGGQVMPLTADEQRGKSEFRLAAHLLRTGRRAAAEAHFERAAELAPEDLTVRRAALQLLGGDPMGADFGPLYGEWMQRTGGNTYRSRN
jgi:hypothetical protein